MGNKSIIFHTPIILFFSQLKTNKKTMNIKELENNLKEILTTVDFKTDDDTIVQQITDTFNSIHNCDKSDQIKFCQYLIENENDLPLLLDKMMINTPSILVFNLII